MTTTICARCRKEFTNLTGIRLCDKCRKHIVTKGPHALPPL